MTLGARFTIEAGHRDDLDRHSLTLRLELDGVKGLAGVLSVGDVDLLDLATTGLEEFEDGVASFDLLAAESLFLTSARCTSRSTDLTTGSSADRLGATTSRADLCEVPDGDSRRLF